MTTPELIEKLEELEDRIPPVPWVRWKQHSDIYQGKPKENTPGILSGANYQIGSFEELEDADLDHGPKCSQCDGDECHDEETHRYMLERTGRRVGDLVVLLRNHLPDVIQGLRALSAVKRIAGGSLGGQMVCPYCKSDGTEHPEDCPRRLAMEVMS